MTVPALERSTISTGIVGAGSMGRWHAQASRRGGGRLVAVVDPDTCAAQKLASRYPSAVTFGSVEQMLTKVTPRVLHICSPSPTHRDIARMAVNAGLHVIVEKPLTLEVADTERLLEQAEEKGVLICPVHQFVFQDGVLKAKRLLPRIGSLIYVGATFCSAGGALRHREQLDGIVEEILPHPLSLMQFFLPSSVSAEWITVQSASGELQAVCESSGTTLSIVISMSARPTECSFVLKGSEATIHLDLFHGFAFVDPGSVSKGRKLVHPFELSVRRISAATINLLRRTGRWEPAYPGLTRLVASFYHAAQAGRDSPISRGDAVAVGRARNRLIESRRCRAAAQTSPAGHLKVTHYAT